MGRDEPVAVRAMGLAQKSNQVPCRGVGAITLSDGADRLARRVEVVQEH
jgi:hypothetical protein